jgi:hypothetical protein
VPPADVCVVDEALHRFFETTQKATSPEAVNGSGLFVIAEEQT